MKRHPPICLLRRLYFSGGRTPSRSQEPWPLHSPPCDRLSPPPTDTRSPSSGTSTTSSTPLTSRPTTPPSASSSSLPPSAPSATPSPSPTPSPFSPAAPTAHNQITSPISAGFVGFGEGAAAGMSAKMHKYRTSPMDLVERATVGCGVGDEIRRAGFAVRLVAGKPEAADAALRREVVGLVERRVAGCVVLVSDDLGFAVLVGMARKRGVWTVVVGDDAGGGLRRYADSGFLWREIVSGKARKEAGVVVGGGGSGRC